MGFARTKLAIALAVVALMGAAAPRFTQAAGAEKVGTLERITVHGKSLEGALEGDSADRTVLVYLPPSYKTDPKRRYPVIYNLHGYTITAEGWSKFLKWPGPLDHAFGSGAVRDMIVVMPDAMTLHNGSMYSNSATTGDWEGFIATDLVAYVDSHYRTLPDRASRGLAGHSMGGYGTVRIGMKHPEVFSTIYALSSCCLAPRGPNEPGVKEIEAIKSPEAAAKGDFAIRGTFAVSAAWAPNPKNPPFFIDFPTKDGVIQPLVIAKWAANAPLAMVDQYIPNLRKQAIGIEIGLQDPGLKDNTELHDILARYGVPHTFETYEGAHTSKIAERYETKVLPFFSTRLSFEPPKRR